LIPARYLGLDLSLTGTGLCVLDAEGAVVAMARVGSDLTRGVHERERIERLIVIAEAVLRVARAAQAEGSLAVGVEDYAFSRRNGALVDLGELGGVVKTQLWLALGVEPVRIPVSTARKSVLGRGNLPKVAVIPALAQRGYEFEDHNIADAYVIAEALRLHTRRCEHGEGASEGSDGTGSGRGRRSAARRPAGRARQGGRQRRG